MAQVPNLKAWTVSDGQTEYANFDTVNKVLQIKNGATLTMYADDGVTAGLTFNATGSAPVVSATSPTIANAGTVTTSGVGVARLTPAGARTGIIMQAGTVNGQSCWLINESTTPSRSIQMDVSGTSNVASGTSCILFGGQGKHFLWDAGVSLWFCIDALTLGTVATIQSATAPVIANAGTIATAGIGVSRVAPGAAVTGIILQAGTIPGQEVWVVNESAAGNTLTLNTTPATSNVADSATESAIAGLKARKYVWDSSTSFWYPAL